MKKNLIALLRPTVALAGLVFLFYACTSKFMDLQPLDKLTEASFWKTEDDLTAATNNIYTASQWGSSGGSWYALAGMPTGDMVPTENPSRIALNELNFLPGNAELNDHWGNCFKGVAKANLVITYGAAIKDIKADFKARRVAEAKFLRGFYYLMLARTFGGVPLVIEAQTANSDLKVPRSTAEQLFTQCASDFTAAAADLPVRWADNEVGRCTKGTALAYLAYTQMYLKNWNGVVARSQDLLNLNRYDLEPEFRRVFSLENENNRESIFEIQYRDMTQGWGPSRQGHYLWIEQPPRGTDDKLAQWGGWGTHVPSAKFANSFERGDRRRPVTIVGPDETYRPEGAVTSFVMKANSTPTGFAFTKYWMAPLPNGNESSPLNLPQMRFAEVLLNYAEALNELGRTTEAYTHINRVRARAGLAPKSGSAKEQCLDDIVQERRVETMCEYNFWFHLTRTQRAIPFLKREYNRDLSNNKLLMPIPTDAMNTNSALVQNPGY